MAAGKLNHRLQIRYWRDAPVSAADIEQEFDFGFSTWGGVEPVKGATYFGAKQVNEEVTHLIKLRMSSRVRETTVTPSHVIDDLGEGCRYRVKRSMDAGGKGRFLHVECELLGTIEGLGHGE